MNYFTSDLHFNSEETLKIDMRPFKNAKMFDKAIIKNFNKQAISKDTIYVIGDFLDCDDGSDLRWKKSIHYVKKIKARVVLILGNNEQRVIKFFFNNNFEKFRKFCLACGFEEVLENGFIKINNYKFYLAHKPADCKKNMLNLFGHNHRAGGVYYPFGFNIGCDLNHFKLYGENDILYLMELKNEYWDKDKHLKLRSNN